MKIFLSSVSSKILRHIQRIFPNRKVNVLRSFGVVTGEDKMFFNGSIKNIGELMLDAGTYTLHFADSTSTKDITIEKYIEYVKKVEKCVDYYANFDCNFTVYGFNDNLTAITKMEKAGLAPFPVIHNYYSNEIDYYLQRRYDFIALGSIMEKGSAKKERRQIDIEYAVTRIPTNDVKVHLFGASSYKTIAHLPIYSCDSSSWALNNKFGFVLYWNPLVEGEDKTQRLFFRDKMSDYYNDDVTYWNEYEYRNELNQYIESLGFNYCDLMGYNCIHYRQLFNAIYYLTIEDVINTNQGDLIKIAA